MVPGGIGRWREGEQRAPSNIKLGARVSFTLSSFFQSGSLPLCRIRLDARISRKFDVGRGTITAFLEVSNLLDRNNICCFDYDLEIDMNGDEFLEYSPDYWLPLLPAVGFLWEF